MADRYEYEDGRCTICREDTKVRWKNIYLIGSEGIDICEPCERDLLQYLRTKSLAHAIKRKEKFKGKRNES